MISNANRPAPTRGLELSPRRRVAIGMLACAALTGLAACAKGKDASADSAAMAAASTADSATMTAPATPAPSTAPADSTKPSPISADGAEKQATPATTTPAQAKRLDEATRAVARQGAETRDTARTGAVTPPPAVRKTATTASTTSKSASAPTSTTKSAATTSSASSGTSATTAARDTNPPASGATTPAAGQTASAQDDHLTAAPAAYQGWKTFHVYCYRCHGVDAMGSDLAPNLRHSVGPEGSVTHEVFVTTVKEGRLAKGMPSWKTLLDDQQIENLWAYLQARSTGKLAPGRPRQAKSD